MRKQAEERPESFTPGQLTGKGLGAQLLPSGVRTQNQAPLGIF